MYCRKPMYRIISAEVSRLYCVLFTSITHGYFLVLDFVKLFFLTMFQWSC